MTSIKKEIMELRQQFYVYDAEGNPEFGLPWFTEEQDLERLEQFLSQALTRIEEAAREEDIDFLEEKGYLVPAEFLREHFVSPSEEKESDCGCCELKHNLSPVNERDWMRVCDMCFTTNCHSPKKGER